MSQYNFESNPEGDWDDRGDLSWNEYDWRQFLKQSDQEIARFLSLYNNLKEDPNHLDEAAHLMGWDAEDWAANDGSDDQHGYADYAGERSRADDENEHEALDPYTLHRHPVYVVTRGLTLYLNQAWENFLLKHSGDMAPMLVWRFAQSTRQIETNAIMALQAVDMGDYGLSICHMKQAMAAINDTFTHLAELPGKETLATRIFCREAGIRLFDLREIYLRTISECREEIRRHPPDSDS